jgi:hypothetical protein
MTADQPHRIFQYGTQTGSGVENHWCHAIVGAAFEFGSKRPHWRQFWLQRTKIMFLIGEPNARQSLLLSTGASAGAGTARLDERRINPFG